MRTRTAILATIAAAALIGDGYLAYRRYFGLNAAITYVGLDNVSLMVPASTRAAQLSDGKWDVDPLQPLRSDWANPPPGQKAEPIAFVSLGPNSGFGKATEVFRDLKAKHVCHVVVREGGLGIDPKMDNGAGPETRFEFPTVALCGGPIGDAGFYGGLPADRLIHDNEAR